MLGVDRRTLYSYASRGWIRRARDGRERLYVAEDVRRLATRSAARRGHRAVAAAALSWGEPVLDSAVSGVVNGRLYYRGRELSALVASGARYEDVGDLLLGPTCPGAWVRAARRRLPAGDPLERMLAITPSLVPLDGAASARVIVSRLAATFGTPRATIAETVARGLGVPDVRAIEVALIVCADHELNASTFAARVAAGTGATLGACVGAAAFAVTGPRHGASHDRLEDLIASLPRRGLGAAVRAKVRSGERLSGFGHALYPDGDPRSDLLLGLVTRSPRARRALDYLAAGEDATGERPAIDAALVTLATSLGAPPRTASGLFALGRSVGWLAHAWEQRSRDPLRPRARYVGPSG